MVVHRIAFLSLCIVASAQTQADMLDVDAMEPWEVCGMCHGLSGVSRMSKFPILAAQKPAYIAEQLKHFRSGERHNDGGQMATMAAELSDKDIAIVADYFSQQARATPAPAESESLYEQGRKRFVDGSKGPACSACHDSGQSQAPWLFAQHQDYLEKQLQDFTAGQRHHSQVLGSLSEPEIEALSVYLSATARELPHIAGEQNE